MQLPSYLSVVAFTVGWACSPINFKSAKESTPPKIVEESDSEGERYKTTSGEEAECNSCSPEDESKEDECNDCQTQIDENEPLEGPRPALPTYVSQLRLSKVAPLTSLASALNSGIPATPWEVIPIVDNLPPIEVIKQTKVNMRAQANINWDGCTSGRYFFNYYLKFEISRDGGRTFITPSRSAPFAITNGGNEAYLERTIEANPGDQLAFKVSTLYENGSDPNAASNCVIGYRVNGILTLSVDQDSSTLPVKVPANFEFGGPKNFVTAKSQISLAPTSLQISPQFAYDGINPATRWAPIIVESPIPELVFPGAARNLVMLTGTASYTLCPNYDSYIILQFGVLRSIDGGANYGAVNYFAGIQNVNNVSITFASPVLFHPEAGNRELYKLQAKIQGGPNTPADCLKSLSINGTVEVTVYPEIH